MENRIDVSVRPIENGSLATVHVSAGAERTEHDVTVLAEDLERYGATDVADLVRRSFAFLLEREPASSILREFRITDIERYFPEFRTAIAAR